MNGWRSATVGELSHRVTKGTTPTTMGKSFVDQGVSFVKVESLRDDGIVDRAKLAFIDSDTQQLLSRSILQPGDILFSIAGTIGRVAMVPADVLPANTNQALAIIRPDSSKVDGRFLMYSLRDTERVAQATSRVVQSVQANLSLSQLSDVQIALPNLPEQQAIAEVLGALDDKIAANAKLAATADALAIADFRKATRGIDFSDRTFADLARVTGGGTPSTKALEYWNGHISWATPTDVTGLSGPYLESTSRTITESGLAACASTLYPAGSILMTSRATIGAFALTQQPTAVNQGFIVVQANDPNLNSWLFHEMRDRVEEFISMANGATFLELGRGTFKKFKVRLAEPSVMSAFQASATVLHELARNALVENRQLATVRDVLLPLLVSGRLRVKEAEALGWTAG